MWRDITPAALENTVLYQGFWKYLEAPEKTPHGFFLLSRASIYMHVCLCTLKNLPIENNRSIFIIPHISFCSFYSSML